MALSERSRNGGIDEVRLPGGPDRAGRLWLCGKHFIGPDPEAAVARVGATTVVCLNEPRELAERYPAYVDWLKANEGDRAVWFPIHDLGAPDAARATDLLADLHARLDAGGTLLLHCGAGIGRAGTMAAALLIGRGASVDDAVATVATSRPMAGPEAGEQTEFLHALATP